MSYILPTFPYFRSPSILDKVWIESFAETVPPHSDFNFANIWAWQEFYRTQISVLDGNLIVLTKHNVKQDSLVLTALAIEKIKPLLDTLISYALENKEVSTIRLLENTFHTKTPERLNSDIDLQKLSLTDDRDNYEYILSVDTQILLSHNLTYSFGRSISMFKKKVREFSFKEQTLADINEQEYINVFNSWCSLKNINPRDNDELTAFKKFIKLKNDNIKILSLFIGGEFVAFNCFELLSTTFAIGHFRKYSRKIDGINEILQLKVTEFLNARGIKFINIEQDLGIEGLRKTKLKLKPAYFLEKYLIDLLF